MSEDEKKFGQTDLDAAASSVKARYTKKLEELEGKNGELSGKLAEFNKRFDELEDKEKTDTEKLQKTNERLMKQLEEKETALTAESERITSIQRDGHIDKLYGNLNLVDGVDKDMMRSVFAKQFEDLDLDGLSSKANTESIVKKFTENNKALVLDTSGNGAGGPHQRDPNITDGEIKLPKTFKGMSSDEARSTLDKAWDAAAATNAQEI